MIPELPEEQMPKSSFSGFSRFGTDLTEWKELLEKSLYYPYSGFDTKPVEVFAGNVHSFIYVDIGKTREELLKWCRGTDGGGSPFSGYVFAYNEPVFLGFASPRLGPEDDFFERMTRNYPEIVNLLEKEILHKYDISKAYDFLANAFAEFLRDQRQRYLIDLPKSFNSKNPFAENCIFESDQGERRISLLFICNEASLIYQSLYWRNNIAPKILFLRQQDNLIGIYKNESPPPICKIHSSVLGKIYTHFMSEVERFPEYLSWRAMSETGQEAAPNFPDPEWIIYNELVTIVPRNAMVPNDDNVVIMKQ